MQIMVKELLIDWVTGFQTPYMGFTETVKERMYKQVYVCFNILNTYIQSNIETDVPLSCLMLIHLSIELQSLFI